jgi:hypothetical protein
MSTTTGTSRSSGRRGLVIAGAVVLALVLAAAAVFGLSGASAEVAFEGPEEDELLNAEAVEQVAFVASTEDDITFDDVVVEHDGEDVTDRAEVEPTSVRYAPEEIDDGEHEVTMAVAGEFGSDEETWTFAVDATPPELEVTQPEDGVMFENQESVVAGTVDPDATLTVDGDEVDVAEDGTFEVEYEGEDGDTLTIVAVDDAGNETAQEHELTVLRTRVEVDEVRAVHMTGNAWNHDGLREQVFEMIEDGKINSVQLDIKGESGRVYNNTEVELAN